MRPRSGLRRASGSERQKKTDSGHLGLDQAAQCQCHTPRGGSARSLSDKSLILQVRFAIRHIKIIKEPLEEVRPQAAPSLVVVVDPSLACRPKPPHLRDCDILHYHLRRTPPCAFSHGRQMLL